MHKNTFFKSVVTTLLLFTSGTIFAHPGHDHESWSSNFVHFLFYYSSAVCVLCIGFAVYKLITKNTSKIKTSS
jgi:hydrogenase/urease accessory protein HupE